MLLNKTYYLQLWKKYNEIAVLPTSYSDKFSILTTKILLDQHRKRNPIHINFQFQNSLLSPIARHLYVEISNHIFRNSADFPNLNVGDKLQCKIPFRVGTPKAKYLEFVIQSICNGKYELRNAKHFITMQKTFDELVKNFVPVTQRVQNKTLSKFASFFEELNGNLVHEFTPTYFEQKSVFIAAKTFYESLEFRNRIPTTYFPNPRDEATVHEIKSIPALPDSIMYFVPKYKICYDNILLKSLKIDTIVIYDCEESEINQIINDKVKYHFNLIVLTNNVNPTRFKQIPLWNWYKEEVEMINTL